MAILTKPTISKGQANEFDLSKSDLAAVSKVVNDSYFSDQANWSKVIVEYKSAEGNQHEMVIFDASEASPKGNFEVSEKAKDSFEVQSVKIMDFDGGYLKLGRDDLNVSDFDVDFSSDSINVFDSSNTDLATFTLSNNDLTSQGTNPDTSSIQYAYLNFELDLNSNDQKVLEFIIDDKGTGSAWGNGFIVAFLNTGDNKDTVAINPDYWPFRGYARINVNNVNTVPNQGSVYVNLDTSTGSESKTGNARGGTGISNGERIRISIDLDANELTFSCFLSDGVTQVGSSFVVDISSPASSFDKLVVAQYMVNDTFGTTIAN